MWLWNTCSLQVPVIYLLDFSFSLVQHDLPHHLSAVGWDQSLYLQPPSFWLHKFGEMEQTSAAFQGTTSFIYFFHTWSTGPDFACRNACRIAIRTSGSWRQQNLFDYRPSPRSKQKKKQNHTKTWSLSFSKYFLSAGSVPGAILSNRVITMNKRATDPTLEDFTFWGHSFIQKIYEIFLHIRYCSPLNKIETIPALVAMVCVGGVCTHTHIICNGGQNTIHISNFFIM